MYNPENEKLIAWTKRIMICGGFWTQPITNNYILEKVFYIYSIIMRISYFVFWFLLVCELIRLIANGYELQVIISSLSVVINASKITLKLIIYMKYNIPELFKNVILKEREIWESNNEEIKALYRRKIRVCKIYIIALGIPTILTVALLESAGAVGLLKIKEYNEANNASLESHFMYQSLIPLNKLDQLFWLFTTQVLWCWLGIVFNSVTHLIFVTLLIYAIAQLEILQVQLRNFVPLEFSESASPERINGNVLFLKSLIVTHKTIIEFVQYFNNCTKYIIMMEFILSSLDLASVSVNIIKMNSSEIGFFAFFLLLLGVQMFLLSWNCNEIKVQSEAIGDALYQSKWYLLNKEAKQLTQIVIIRAQRPLIMTIGPLGPMTTTSALLVIKAAYSYVSIMKE